MAERLTSTREEPLPLSYSPPKHEPAADKAGQYVPNPELTSAVQVALDLGMPLLLTGEPGTGKTQLAHWLALEMFEHQPQAFGTNKPEVFNTKSTSVYSELFYRYDAIRHFHMGKDKPIEDFIAYEALGKAILRARDEKKRTVVLIDEVDKAPRDLPNDILNEIEEMQFTIRENGKSIEADPAFPPVLIFTSNRERDLPDAFRRRCVFHHIDFKKLDLEKIVRARLGKDPAPPETLLNQALTHFQKIRALDKKLEKLPATAELIAWVRYLIQVNADLSTEQGRKLLGASYSLLAKSDADLDAMNKVSTGA